MEKLLTGKYKKVAIIGFSKCGTTSLRKHLKSLGCEVQQVEIIYYLDTPQGFEYAKKHLKGYKLVTMWRNNAERLWSGWHFFRFNTKKTFENFIKGNGNAWHGVGMNGIEQCDYEYYENEWRNNGFKVLSISLEDVKKILPRENKSNAGDVPKEARDLVEQKFKEWQESGQNRRVYEPPAKWQERIDKEAIKTKPANRDMTLEDMINAVKNKA